MGEPRSRWIVPLLLAVLVAGVTLKVFVHGNYCLVPSTFLQPGEEGTAETSVYGLPLYRGAGTDHQGMYRAAVWWYETTLLAEWAVAVAVGAGAYLLVRWLRGCSRVPLPGQAQRPSKCSASEGDADVRRSG
jgi:hypothetical protein